MSQGIMHGDLVCKLNEELLGVKGENARLSEAYGKRVAEINQLLLKSDTMAKNFSDAIAALESCGNSPTARLDARAYTKKFRRRLKK